MSVRGGGRRHPTRHRHAAGGTDWLALVRDVATAVGGADTVEEALRLAMDRLVNGGACQVGCVYLPEPDAPGCVGAPSVRVADTRFAPFARACRRPRPPAGTSLPDRVYRTGGVLRANSQDALRALMPRRGVAASNAGLLAVVALPVTVGGGPVAVLELFSDRARLRKTEIAALMGALDASMSRHVERERVMSHVAEMVWREQQDLIHTLHDALGQELTGMGMMSSGLAQRLEGLDPEGAGIARHVASGLERVLDQFRQLSRGRFSLDVDAAGLQSRLEQLALATDTIYKIPCRLEYDSRTRIHDDRVATQLYRIAQEAVTNALRHAKATRIAIRVHTDDGLIVLSVADDGVGIQDGASGRDGMGLRIMRHRAISIGAAVSLGSGSNGGTRVTCSLREAHHSEP